MQDLKSAMIEYEPQGGNRYRHFSAVTVEGYRNEFPAWIDADGKMVAW